MGVVAVAVFINRGIADIAFVKVYTIVGFQPQWGSKGGACIISRNWSAKNTNFVAIYLEKNIPRIILRIVLLRRELKVVDSWDWSSKYSRGQVEGITLVETFKFKRDDGIIRIETRFPLNVKMNALRLDVDISNDFFGNYYRFTNFIKMLRIKRIKFG